MLKKIILLILFAMAVSCQPPGTEPSASDSLKPEEESSQEVEMSIPETFNDPHVTSAMSQLAAKLDISSDEIEIMKAEPKVWSDSSMGCPQEGMMYMQVLVEDGMLIELKAAGAIYSYHSGNGQDPFLCETTSTS